jgi:hypothetical protein
LRILGHFSGESMMGHCPLLALGEHRLLRCKCLL